MQALFHSTAHASGIKTAEEGLQRLKNLSFAQKRALICHLHSKGDTIQNLKFALYMQICRIKNRKARNAKEKELILFSLQKLWQSFTF
jgi:hypothetical protein